MIRVSGVAHRDHLTVEPGAVVWPGPSNTGVPAGTVLTNYTGPSGYNGTQDITITDQIISSELRIYDSVNITLLRCIVTGNIDCDSGTASFTATDSEIQAQDWRNASVGFQNLNLLRCNLHGGTTSLNASNNVQATDCWLHGQVVVDQDHAGGFLCSGGGNTTLTHCYVVCDVLDNGLGGGPSASVNLYGDFAPLHDIHFENVLIGHTDGAYAASFGYNPGKPYGSNPMGIWVRNCVFERGPNGMGGSIGTVTSFLSTEPTNIWFNNTWDDGTPIPSDI
jgi:hypothetical protein